MKKLTFKEFKKNDSVILAVGEEQIKLRYKWLKKHNYEYLNSGHSKKYELKCYGGGTKQVGVLDTASYNFQDMNIYSVYQLEDWDKLDAKEMTVSEISKELGYKVKIIE